MERELKVYLPYPKSAITQRFGENANVSYSRDGLKGHTAYDWGVPYGTAIPNCVKDAYCYSRMHESDPDLGHYRAVFFIVETETGVYEVSYGHLSEFVAEVGKVYQPGDTIGYIGNTGDVFVGAHEVTEAEKEAGSHAGAHLHGPQIRVLRKVKQFTKGTERIYSANGQYLKLNGYYFEVPNYNNGYNGCVSLAPFSTETLATDYHGPILAQPQPDVFQQAVAIGHAGVELAQNPGLPAPERSWFLQVLEDFLNSFKR